MRRGLLQDYANTMRDIAEGWRMFNDVDTLLELGSGTIEIDVLSGSACVDGELIAPLHIAGELHHWLIERRELDRCPAEVIVSARVVIEFASQRSQGPFAIRRRCSATVSGPTGSFAAPPST